MRESNKHRLGITTVFTIGTLLVFSASALVVLIAWFVLSKTGVLRQMVESLSPETAVILVMLIAVAVGTLLTFVAGPVIVRPLNSVVNTMSRLASGKYDARLHPGKFWYRISFVREFTDSFNTMADEIGHTEMLRTDFINSFSHEFKTPIVSIAGFAKLLRTEGLEEKEREEYLSVIEKESLRLSDMANKVLMLTRIEGRDVLNNRVRYNLSEQLRQCLLLFTDAWSEKELDIDPDFDEHEIVADRELLEQVWINLIENAVKFSPRGGAVRVTVRDAGETLVVAVENSGSSIAPENLTRVFRKFFREDSSHAAPGNGVGLAVVQRVTELHGGTVTAESAGDKTAFTVTLPKGI